MTSAGRRHGRRTATAIVALVAAAIVAGLTALSAMAAPSLAQKRAQAARVTAQVNRLDNEYDHLQERFRGAMYRLAQLQGQVRRLGVDLDRTQSELEVAERRLVDRAVVVYQNGSSTTSIVSLVEAGSLSKFVDRMDAIRRVGDQDADILEAIQRLRVRIEVKRVQLKEARDEQSQLVRQARADKDAMGARLVQRQQVLNSVTAEIRELVAAQRRAELARQAAVARASAAAVRTGGGGVSSPAASGDSGTAFEPAVGLAPPASGAAAQAASIAMTQIGVPYVWGGASPSTGFDCSGLVMWSFAQVGISLPHSSYALWNVGVHVSRSELQTGDLVFFSGLGHMGIYVGGGSYVHAPRSGTTVRVNSLYDSYGTSNYVGAVRVT